MMAGHIMRIEEGRFPNNILSGKFHNTLSVGKPEQVQILGIRGLSRGGAF